MANVGITYAEALHDAQLMWVVEGARECYVSEESLANPIDPDGAERYQVHLHQDVADTDKIEAFDSSAFALNRPQHFTVEIRPDFSCTNETKLDGAWIQVPCSYQKQGICQHMVRVLYDVYNKNADDIARMYAGQWVHIPDHPLGQQPSIARIA
jgi:hypothetical protein